MQEYDVKLGSWPESEDPLDTSTTRVSYGKSAYPFLFVITYLML